MLEVLPPGARVLLEKTPVAVDLSNRMFVWVRHSVFNIDVGKKLLRAIYSYVYAHLPEQVRMVVVVTDQESSDVSPPRPGETMIAFVYVKSDEKGERLVLQLTRMPGLRPRGYLRLLVVDQSKQHVVDATRVLYVWDVGRKRRIYLAYRRDAPPEVQTLE